MRRALPVALALPLLAACGGPNAAVRANEALFRSLPLYPGTKVVAESSDGVRRSESGPVVGWSTRYVVELPPGSDPGTVLAFYRRSLPRWRLFDRSPGPVLTLRRGADELTLNLDNAPAGRVELAVRRGGLAGYPPGPLRIPTLSPLQRARALAILRADPRVARLLGGHAYAVTGIVVWTTFTQRLLGAGLDLRLTPPARLPAAGWPAIDYDEAERTDPPYAETTVRLPEQTVGRVAAQVDLRRGRLVALQPLPG